MGEVADTNARDEAFLNSLYGAALDPSRLGELVEAWQERLGELKIEAFSGPDIENHLAMAFQISDRIGSEDSALQPQININPDGTVNTRNAAAQREYSIEAGDHVTGLPFEAELLAKLKKVLRAKSRLVGEFLAIGQRTDLDRAAVLVLTAQNDGFSLRTTDLVWSETLKELLQNAFGLTPAECEVAQFLAEGATQAETAELRGTSFTTVRAQTRSIYEKTQVHNVAELTRLIIGLAGLASSERSVAPNVVSDGAPHPRAEERLLHQLPDGRLLEYAVLGASKGIPILVLHDEHLASAWTQAAIEEAQKLGLTLILPLRPRYGRTQELPDDVDERRMQVARDTFDLLDALGQDWVGCIARGMGAGVACCMSSLQPSRITNVLSVVPALPVVTENLPKINPFARVIIHSLFHNRSLARFIVASRLRLARMRGLQHYLANHFLQTEADRTLLEQPMMLQTVEHGLALCDEGSFQGFLGDVIDAGFSFERCVELIKCPTHIFLGEFDVHGRHERAQHLVEMSNWVTMEVLPGRGELLFFSEHKKILAHAKNAYARASQ
ncbi:MAG: LuxR C-terminal-related transcriptional regulator [Pseudomonadota bacterium]